jgi:hypothetical protein
LREGDRDDVEEAPAEAGWGGDVDEEVLGIGGGQGEVAERVGGGSEERKPVSGGGCWVCKRVFTTSNGVTANAKQEIISTPLLYSLQQAPVCVRILDARPMAARASSAG